MGHDGLIAPSDGGEREEVLAHRRALIVCTANVCRSPVAQRLLQRAFDERVQRGDRWTVRSAGTSEVDAPADPWTSAVAEAMGLDLSDHVRRRLDRGVIEADGADLVLTLTREHLRHVVAVDPGAWPRTFTVKELARRARLLGRPAAGETFEAWRDRVAAGRSARDMLDPGRDDDIADPYGRSRRHHEAMALEVRDAVLAIVRHVPS